jgi:hypothetical protein
LVLVAHVTSWSLHGGFLTYHWASVCHPIVAYPRGFCYTERQI